MGKTVKPQNLTRKEKQELHRAVLEGRAPPMQLLVAMYNDAEEGIRYWLNQRVMEIVAIDIPKQAMVQQMGRTIDRSDKDFATCKEIFGQSMRYAQEEVPQLKKDMSATVEHSGERIAEIIDSCVQRIMMEDNVMNRAAWMDVLCHHAKLTRALMGITQVSEAETHEPAAKAE